MSFIPTQTPVPLPSQRPRVPLPQFIIPPAQPGPSPFGNVGGAGAQFPLPQPNQPMPNPFSVNPFPATTVVNPSSSINPFPGPTMPASTAPTPSNKFQRNDYVMFQKWVNGLARGINSAAFKNGSDEQKF